MGKDPLPANADLALKDKHSTISAQPTWEPRQQPSSPSKANHTMADAGTKPAWWTGMVSTPERWQTGPNAPAPHRT